MLARPRVSILLPVRDAERTLPAALASIARQTLVDWQLVAVDDGSTDATPALLAAAACRDPRVHVLRTPARGIVAALGAGLTACTAPLVARMDADDVMHRERLAAQHAWFAERPGLDLVGCHVRELATAPPTDGRRAYLQWLTSLRDELDLRRDALIECPLPHPTWMARREVLAELGWRDRPWAEDHDLLLRLWQRGGRIDVLPRRLHLWRDRPDRLSRTDPRYALARFTELRAEFLRLGFLAACEEYVLWGYGSTGRTLARALARHGRRPRFIVELHARRIGNRIAGAPVVPVTQIDQLPPIPIVASVAGAVARRTIREALLRIGRVELRDFICAA